MQAKPQGAEQLVEGMEVRDKVRRRSENTERDRKERPAGSGDCDHKTEAGSDGEDPRIREGQDTELSQ